MLDTLTAIELTKKQPDRQDDRMDRQDRQDQPDRQDGRDIKPIGQTGRWQERPDAVGQTGRQGEASAGVDYGRAALEVLYLLPDSFVKAYEQLFHEALREDSSSPLGGQQKRAELGKATGKKTKESQVAIKAGKGKGGGPGGQFTIKSEQAFQQKKQLDKRLRQMAREIGMSDEEREKGKLRNRVRCSGCGRWVDADWRYCAWCGEDWRR